MNYPTVQDFKDYFVRDFPYVKDPLNPDPNTEILDADIQRAINEAILNFVSGCYDPEQEPGRTAFLYLVAHYLVINIQTSNSGLNGGFNYDENSKSVGNVSVSYHTPEWVGKSPFYLWLSKTGYGVRYLNMITPCIVGAVFCVPGRTTP